MSSRKRSPSSETLMQRQMTDVGSLAVTASSEIAGGASTPSPSAAVNNATSTGGNSTTRDSRGVSDASSTAWSVAIPNPLPRHDNGLWLRDALTPVFKVNRRGRNTDRSKNEDGVGTSESMLTSLSAITAVSMSSADTNAESRSSERRDDGQRSSSNKQQCGSRSHSVALPYPLLSTDNTAYVWFRRIGLSVTALVLLTINVIAWMYAHPVQDQLTVFGGLCTLILTLLVAGVYIPPVFPAPGVLRYDRPTIITSDFIPSTPKGVTALLFFIVEPLFNMALMWQLVQRYYENVVVIPGARKASDFTRDTVATFAYISEGVLFEPQLIDSSLCIPIAAVVTAIALLMFCCGYCCLSIAIQTFRGSPTVNFRRGSKMFNIMTFLHFTAVVLIIPFAFALLRATHGFIPREFDLDVHLNTSDPTSSRTTSLSSDVAARTSLSTCPYSTALAVCAAIVVFLSGLLSFSASAQLRLLDDTVPITDPKIPRVDPLALGWCVLYRGLAVLFIALPYDPFPVAVLLFVLSLLGFALVWIHSRVPSSVDLICRLIKANATATVFSTLAAGQFMFRNYIDESQAGTSGEEHVHEIAGDAFFIFLSIASFVPTIYVGVTHLCRHGRRLYEPQPDVEGYLLYADA